MSQNKTSVHAPRPKYMGRQTDIRAPSVRTDWDSVNGKPKYTLIPPEIGPITIIDSDDEDEMKPILRAVTLKVKCESSQSPTGQPHPRIKREFSISNLLGGHRSNEASSPPASDSRYSGRGPQNHANDSSRLSNPGPSGSSASSVPGRRSVLSSKALCSDSASESTSSEDADSDIYTPSTPPSRISSTSPRTRGQTAQQGLNKKDPESPLRQSLVSGEGSRVAPAGLDFYIEIPKNKTRCQSVSGERLRLPTTHQGVSTSQVCLANIHY